MLRSTITLIALTLMLSLSGLGQDKKKEAEPKKLTAAEMSQITTANQELQGHLNNLQKALDGTLNVTEDKAAEAAGWKISKIYGMVKEGQAKLNSTVDGLLKKYDCATCTIGQDGTLTPAPAK